MPKPQARLRVHQPLWPLVGLGRQSPARAAAPLPARPRREQSGRCGLGLGARRSGGPGEAGLRANPAPFPAAAWGCERSDPVVHPLFISAGL